MTTHEEYIKFNFAAPLKVHPRVWENFWQLKNDEKSFYFIFMSKAPFFLKIFTFLFCIFGYESGLSRKHTGQTNNYNTHIKHCLKKWKQLDNEIRSVNGI